MVPGDGIHQFALVNGQSVSEADDDVAPQILPRLQEQTVRPFRGVVRRQFRQYPVDVVDALVGQYLVDVADAALLNGEQVSLLVSQVADVVDERHKQIQFGAAPEVVRFLGAGGVGDDGVRHRLDQLRLRVQPVEAVPAVRVLHVQKVHGLDVVALFREVGRQLLEQLPLGVRHKHRLSPLGAADQERDDESPRLSAAGRADTQEIVVVAGTHRMRHIDVVLVRVVRMALELAQGHARHVRHGI